MTPPALLEINRLAVADTRNGRVLLSDMTLTLPERGCTAIVGESGGGKSLLCKSLLGLLPPWLRVSGETVFRGRDLQRLSSKEWLTVRGKQIALIMQDAASAFDPLYTVGNHLDETLTRHTALTRVQRRVRAQDLLGNVGLRDAAELLAKYPHQLSGGMLQRVMIAIALASQPALIIADEPTTSLDGITQYHIVQQFIRLQKNADSAMLFVSHDLALVRALAQYVVVMKDGRIVEQGETERVFAHPEQDYTRGLIDTRRRLSRAFNQLMGK
ncbi:Oligopeptide transport ATP-binding protein OppD [Dickeya dianthicola]|uniref:ABC transporter ATP-binding protein n=1 Tax=Dickeya dianthicola TaxID=204039 RepID=A0AAP2CZM1_9GAMM|nr:ABC transporter ATP-binding protein [Dickeya dianthicola]ATO32578.1 ABC transporter ATP-binding protein [Dickeya dianthicola RNS04.9]AYC18584.1 Oligopeptide transport ATP-binding protein OppD [Dickeya dianthicola]MBI0439071.1 ABC transporter ATP-binding protein [Dickeya dianthicola]MBI0450321.1 ABC transporter ATP-binding protein [Dickeya dianthicola]MBI0454961.1 ABC transporter ATP-binding protein [Dickeya dianthicola]